MVLGVPWGSVGFIGGALGSLGGSPGGPRGSSRRAREAPNTQVFLQGVLGRSRGSPGVILVVGVGLGTDLESGNVDISLDLKVLFCEVCFALFLLSLFIFNLLFDVCKRKVV